MDIDKDRLGKVAEICRYMIRENKLPAKVVALTNRRRALEGADYVLCLVRVGGLEAFKKDIRSHSSTASTGRRRHPQCRRHHVRSAHHSRPTRHLPRHARRLPRCLLINHTNPMAMNTWAVSKAGGVRYVGLCHGVEAA